MKKIYLTLLSCFIAIVTMAQTPGFNYQAVILNPNVQSLPGNDVEQGLLSESDIAIRFTIENELGTEYQETHTTKTDAYGMVSLIVGQGIATIGNFTDVAWVGSEKYLKVEIDFTASGASYEGLDRQALTYLPQPVSNETMAIINQIKADITNNNNNNDLQNEVIRATAAEQVISDALDAEIVRATAAEGANATAISDETNRATAAEGANATAISDETNRATAAEGANATAISDETNRATAAEGANATAISDETTRAMGTESYIDNRITVEIARATAAEGANATAISTNNSSILANTATGQTNANNIATHNSTDLDLDATNELQTLSIIGDTLFISSGNYIILPPPTLLGCTDSTAINYNALANTDNGTCIAKVLGCTDPSQINYDSLANTDDGSCIPFIYGCMDSTQFNFNINANIDVPGGSCIPIVLGCTDSLAFNYDSLANTDNSSCIPITYGCMDTLACNYDIAVNVDDSSCLLPDGCTDPAAFNYDSTATCDDGSCASAIGDSYQGGIIFYLDGNGGGLICATEDQTYPTGTYWGCWGTSVTGTSMSLGTGAANTAALISQGCASTGKPASLCSDYTGGGYTDWYLPSYYELVKMFEQRNVIAANPDASPFATWVSGGAVHYWSSSASSACYSGGSPCHIYAHAMRWSTNYYLYGTESNRNTNHSVRAIRSF